MKKSKSKTIIVKEKANLQPFARSKELNHIVYWTTILILFIANLFMAIAMIPFILLAFSFDFYIILALLGTFSGYVFTHLIRNIENLDRHHHMIAVLTIPVFAIINMIIVSTSLESMTKLLGIASQKDPVTVSLVYAIFFLLPYVMSKTRTVFEHSETRSVSSVSMARKRL